MENVFADIPSAIEDDYQTEEKTQKLKRHAFFFINVEPDSSNSAIDDLKQVEGVIKYTNP